jgi:hypothetical protein
VFKNLFPVLRRIFITSLHSLAIFVLGCASVRLWVCESVDLFCVSVLQHRNPLSSKMNLDMDKVQKKFVDRVTSY